MLLGRSYFGSPFYPAPPASTGRVAASAAIRANARGTFTSAGAVTTSAQTVAEALRTVFGEPGTTRGDASVEALQALIIKIVQAGAAECAANVSGYSLGLRLAAADVQATSSAVGRPSGWFLLFGETDGSTAVAARAALHPKVAVSGTAEALAGGVARPSAAMLLAGIAEALAGGEAQGALHPKLTTSGESFALAYAQGINSVAGGDQAVSLRVMAVGRAQRAMIVGGSSRRIAV